jgi:erythromycin esterase-like protein
MGFTIFSIEANMPEAFRLNDYVLHGTGDPAQLLRGMYFWTWNTEEVLEMIRWMRAFNASGRGRVQFTGFDMQTHTVALDILRRFVRRYDSAYVTALASASAGIPAGPDAGGRGFGVATATFPVTQAAGKTVRFSGYIKTEGVTTGYAGLWWRVDGARGSPTLAFDNMAGRGATGTADWRKFTIELPVDRSATNINFGALMPGNGTAWIDDLAIELDGQPFTDTSIFDLGFEAAVPRGFYTGGRGYRVMLDTVAHGGRQSLRMTQVAPVDTTPPIDRRAIVAQWSDVLAHLEQQRASYRVLGASDRDVDWAMQNARVVLQAIQMRLNLVSRDRSMALNVKWILDQNSEDRIVLWAHNGHVARGPAMFRSMGQELHELYGEQMVVLGFAFNRGSFQAIGARGGGLKNFTVAPAPAGSFDALLGAAGIPIFALDLRNAPPWLREERLTRQIGSMFATETESNYLMRISAPAVFDAILFVENTTAARPVVPR